MDGHTGTDLANDMLAKDALLSRWEVTKDNQWGNIHIEICPLWTGPRQSQHAAPTAFAPEERWPPCQRVLGRGANDRIRRDAALRPDSERGAMHIWRDTMAKSDWLEMVRFRAEGWPVVTANVGRSCLNR